MLLWFLTITLFAKSNTERLGDILALTIPSLAYSSTYYFDDDDGRFMFYKSYGMTMMSTYILKYTVDEKRPDNNDRDSFPSGHTASAFGGAAFVHRRYGIKYAIPLYLGALYTGYSRVSSHRHHLRDVIAGALVAGAWNYYFVSPIKNLQITPLIGDKRKGLALRYKF